MRSEEETEIRRNIEDQGLMSYSERLLEEYRTGRNDRHVVSTSSLSYTMSVLSKTNVITNMNSGTLKND